jgi:NAD(P)-dependent dehydrogenase (short-subunit alcohol dehydrogenase family)
MQLAGLRALVTGGTQGIGAAVAARLRMTGAAMLITARHPPAQLPEGVSFAAADLATAAGCAAVAEAVRDRLGGVDIIVHAVGGSYPPAGGFALSDDEEWRRALDLNLLAAVRLDRILLPEMLSRGSGVIIHITSIQDRLPLPDATIAYAAGEGCIVELQQGSVEGGEPKGVRVVRVAPGWVETEAAVRLVQRLAETSGGDYAIAQQSLMASLGGILPDGRRSQRVADLVAFLASPRAAAITGTEYVIDGGTVPTV